MAFAAVFVSFGLFLRQSGLGFLGILDLRLVTLLYVIFGCCCGLSL
uniref:Uncharacterized protein n=1 Tax=Rhizophora mucronata TaxID=61149 RepID=A0A2P2N0Z8_RHIMU